MFEVEIKFGFTLHCKAYSSSILGCCWWDGSGEEEWTIFSFLFLTRKALPSLNQNNDITYCESGQTFSKADSDFVRWNHMNSE